MFELKMLNAQIFYQLMWCLPYGHPAVLEGHSPPGAAGEGPGWPLDAALTSRVYSTLCISGNILSKIPLRIK